MNDEVSIRSIALNSIFRLLFGIAGFTLGCLCFWAEYITKEMRTLLGGGFIIWPLTIMGGVILMYGGLHDLALLVWRKEEK